MRPYTRKQRIMLLFLLGIAIDTHKLLQQIATRVCVLQQFW